MQSLQTSARKWVYNLSPLCYTKKQSTARWVASLLFIGIYSLSIYAQQDVPNSLFLEELFENHLLDEQRYENWVDSTFVLPKRININTAQPKELLSLPFLSEKQVNDIIMTRDFQGKYLAITDLRLIASIKAHTYSLLKQYCTIEDRHTSKISRKNLLHYSKHQVISQIDLPLYKRQGYLYSSKTDSRPYYLGQPWGHYIRYDGHYRKQLYWGFTLAQGTGEPFFTYNQNRYDYIGYYALLQNTGRIRQLAIGKYRVHMGLGLTINQNLLIGKGAALDTKQSLNYLFSKHSSKSESNYLEGVATDIRLTKQIYAAAFASCRNIDATIEDGYIKSIQTTGYHRSINELNRKNQAQQYTIGARTYYRPKEQFQLGLHTLYTSYNGYYNPPLRYYNTYYFRGKHNTYIGADYYLHWRSWYLAGEIASSQNGALAILQTAQWKTNRYLQLDFALRYYDVNYQSIFGQSLSAATRPQNEQGIYIGMRYKPWSHGEISAYFDAYYFPQPTYGTGTASTGYESIVQYQHKQGDFTHTIRYRWKERGKNTPKDWTTDNQQFVWPYHQHQIRYQLIHTPNSHWCNQAKLYTTMVGYQNYPNTQGLLGLVSSRYQNKHWSISGQVAIFDTDDYASRCTIYEPNTLYGFYFPACFGQGIRTAVVTKYSMYNKHLQFTMKAGHFHYFDRTIISSGHNAIAAPYKTDITLQCKWCW